MELQPGDRAKTKQAGMGERENSSERCSGVEGNRRYLLRLPQVRCRNTGLWMDAAVRRWEGTYSCPGIIRGKRTWWDLGASEKTRIGEGMECRWGICGEKSKRDGGTKNRQLDQGDAGAEQSVRACWVAVPPGYSCGGARATKPLTHSALHWLNFGWRQPAGKDPQQTESDQVSEVKTRPAKGLENYLLFKDWVPLAWRKGGRSEKQGCTDSLGQCATCLGA